MKYSLVLLCLSIGLTTTLCSAAYDIPYNGKELHLNTQYRANRQDFVIEGEGKVDEEERNFKPDKYNHHSHYDGQDHHQHHHHHHHEQHHSPSRRHHHHHSHNHNNNKHHGDYRYYELASEHTPHEDEEPHHHHHHHDHPGHHHDHHRHHQDHHGYQSPEHHHETHHHHSHHHNDEPHHHRNHHHHHHHHHQNHHDQDGSQLQLAEKIFQEASEVMRKDPHLRPHQKHRHYEFYNKHYAQSQHGKATTVTTSTVTEREKQPYNYHWGNNINDRGKFVSTTTTKHQNTFQKSMGSITRDDSSSSSKTTSTKHSPSAVAASGAGTSTTKPDDDESRSHRHHSPLVWNNGWLDSITMFAIWSLDNLFWLIPFVAHSKTNAIYFFLTYQVAVLVSCFPGSSYYTNHNMTFSHARTLNIVWGGLGSIFCWILALAIFFIGRRQQQNHYCLLEHDHRGFGEGEGEEENSIIEVENQKDDLDLEAPLLEKARSGKQQQGSTSILISITSLTTPVTPGAFLTVGMTLLSAVDDLFFVPVLAQQPHITTISQIFVGSFAAVLLWSLTAVVLVSLFASRLSSELVNIPLFVVLGIYALVMTGHCSWDILQSSNMVEEIKLHLHQVVQYLSLFFAS